MMVKALNQVWLPVRPSSSTIQLTLIAAGNHWHFDCVKCNTCDRLLDSNDTLLVLRDGSHICRHCKYRCPVCGTDFEKRELPRVSVTEFRYHPFYSACDKCRQCKSESHNIWAGESKTSYGIFCIHCWEKLELLALRMRYKNY